MRWLVLPLLLFTSCESITATLDHVVRLDDGTAAQVMAHARRLGEARDLEVFPHEPGPHDELWIYPRQDLSRPTVLYRNGPWVVASQYWINRVPGGAERDDAERFGRLVFRRLRAGFPALPNPEVHYWARSEEHPEPPQRPWEAKD